jgi:hypothetical protein
MIQDQRKGFSMTDAISRSQAIEVLEEIHDDQGISEEQRATVWIAIQRIRSLGTSEYGSAEFAPTYQELKRENQNLHELLASLPVVPQPTEDFFNEAIEREFFSVASLGQTPSPALSNQRIGAFRLRDAILESLRGAPVEGREEK